MRDGYIESNVSAVPNAYIALAAGRLGRIAGWLGKDSDAVYYNNISKTILATMRAQLFDAESGSFADGT
eukprot:SAG31_NODE_285_length_18479_cov_9.871980_7_plen_69_part_00